MINYETYKLIHLLSLIVLMACFGIGFFAETPKKWARITGSLSSLLLFVAGMGLIARIGINHGEGWPLWIKLKLGIWLVLATAVPILSKRLKTNRTLVFFLLLSLFASAVSVAIFKPL